MLKHRSHSFGYRSNTRHHCNLMQVIAGIEAESMLITPELDRFDKGGGSFFLTGYGPEGCHFEVNVE